jgi:hypothetical protein
MLNKITLCLQVYTHSVQHASVNGPSTTTNWRQRPYFCGEQWIDYREHGQIIPSSSPSRMEIYLQRDAHPLSSLPRNSSGNNACLSLCNAFLDSTKVMTLRRQPKSCGQEALTVEERECKKLPLYWKTKSRGTTIFNKIWVWRKLIYTNTVLFFLKIN